MQSAEISALKTLRSGFFYLFVTTIMLVAVAEFGPTTITYLTG
jgi:hypothetical protein